jgi:hypothetical protein
MLYIVPMKTHLTKAQEEIADRMARKAQQGSDLFVKILAKTHSGAHRSCVLVCIFFFIFTVTKIFEGEGKRKSINFPGITHIQIFVVLEYF